MYSFEGQFKSRRPINLGGTPQHDKKELLRRAHQERKAREEERRRHQAATKLQARFRGQRTRAHLQQKWRQDWDAQRRNGTQTSKDQLYQSWLTLLYYYRPTMADQERLREMCTVGFSSTTVATSTLRQWQPVLSATAMTRFLLVLGQAVVTTASSVPVDMATLRVWTATFNDTLRALTTVYPHHHPLVTTMLRNATRKGLLRYFTRAMSSLSDQKFSDGAHSVFQVLAQWLNLVRGQIAIADRDDFDLALVTDVFAMYNFPLDQSADLAFVGSVESVFETLTTVLSIYFMPDAGISLSFTERIILLHNLVVLHEQVTLHSPHRTGLLSRYVSSALCLLNHLPDHKVPAVDSTNAEERAVPFPSDYVTQWSTTLPLLYRAQNLARLAILRLDNGDLYLSWLATLVITWSSAKSSVLHHLLYQTSDAIVSVLWNTLSTSPVLSQLTGPSQLADLSLLTDHVEELGYFWDLLYLLSELVRRYIITMSDNQLDEVRRGTLLGIPLKEFVSLGRNLSFTMLWNPQFLVKATSTRVSTVLTVEQLGQSLVQLTRQLHDLNNRALFMDAEEWMFQPVVDVVSYAHRLAECQLRIESSESDTEDQAEIEDEEDENEESGTTLSPPEQLGMLLRRANQHADAPQMAPQLNHDGPALYQPVVVRPGGGGDSRHPTSGRSALTSVDMALQARWNVLTQLPFVVPFEHRVKIFREMILLDQQQNNISTSLPVYRVEIHRTQVFEDGFAQLNPLGAGLKQRVAISFVDQYGLTEAGIDGGGVFKEFFNLLTKEAFNPHYGFFLHTSNQMLYPNPQAHFRQPTQLEYYRFLGRIIGKALYEGIVMDVQFAAFFLNKWLGKTNYVNDLASLDPVLYQGLMQLRAYSGDVNADFGLNFTVNTDDLGTVSTVNLLPNGSDIPVTHSNRTLYIYLVSNFRLNVQIHRQCQAFFQGLSDIIPPGWLRLFDQQELQTLVSGASASVDCQDLQQHTVYGGDYHPDHLVIQRFWRVVTEFSDDDKHRLVKFITSCPRPPLLGFGELEPKICIRSTEGDTDRLPTASTCVNLLKLPPYPDETTMRDKLLYSIRAEAGFDLS
ncbi:ubiquitin-protein ligase (E3) [Dispira parvispora]|uniref:HECT-type E3 ubiquitin transferase n=1 Tax=Dispira parvispora TaxID=1520584 RepID=A0A9W8E8S3_9FUNG|nr:ubiquitin-protein ligase (E3) [Dispira parvispora]